MGFMLLLSGISENEVAQLISLFFLCRKIFVGGLPRETREGKLFSSFLRPFTLLLLGRKRG